MIEIVLLTPGATTDPVGDASTRRDAIARELAAHWADRGLPLPMPALQYLPGGKPVLPAGSLHHSIAHCGAAGLLGLAPPSIGPIGVDLERVRPIAFPADRRAALLAIGQMLAGPLGNERGDAQTANAPASRDGDAEAIRAWTRLEAIAKATGSGLGPWRRFLRSGCDLDAARKSAAGWTIVDIALPPSGIDERLCAALAYPATADDGARLPVPPIRLRQRRY